MSTKIYDAYIMENTNMIGIKQFIDVVRGECIKAGTEILKKSCASKVSKIIDSIAIAKAERNEEKYQELLLQYYAEMNDTLYNRLHKKEVEKVQVKDTVEHMKTMYSPLYIAKQCTENKMEISELKRHYMFNSLDMKNEIALFPLDNTHTLFMVFGEQIRKIMENILADDEWHDFREKYVIRDYHYQNQVEKPEYISDEDWEQRRKDWDKVLPSGVPSNDGLIVNLTNASTYDDICLWGEDDVFSFINGIEKRAEYWARKYINEIFNAEYKDSPPIDGLMKMFKMIDDPNTKYGKIYQKKVEQYREILPEIKSKDLSRKNL